MLCCENFILLKTPDRVADQLRLQDGAGTTPAAIPHITLRDDRNVLDLRTKVFTDELNSVQFPLAAIGLE